MDSEKEDELAFQILNCLEYSQERGSLQLKELFKSLVSDYVDKNETNNNLRIDIESNYNGLILGDEFEIADFYTMFGEFKNGRKLHAKYAIKIIDEAIRLLKNLPNIQEITLQEKDECVVVGDLHGSFEDLRIIVDKFKIPGETCYFIFNGDWVDRGKNQIEVLLIIFYSFILYPNRVMLNRGNHEDHAINCQSSYHPCLRTVTQTYFGTHGRAVYQKLDAAFTYTPFATIVNNPLQSQRIFVVHGGVTDKIILNDIQKLDRSMFDSICTPHLPEDSLEATYAQHIQDLLWSDPISDDEQDKEILPNSKRNISKRFGVNVTTRFLELNNVTHIIRSHECQKTGFKVMHDAKLFIVFSASNYTQENRGSVLKISSERKRFNVQTYNSNEILHKTRKITGRKDNLSKAIKSLLMYLYKLKPFIMDDFKRIDVNNTGVITIDEFVKVLDSHLPDVPYMKIKDRLCECDDNLNRAHYETLFEFVTINSKNDELLQNLFHSIDTDNSGQISPDELRNALNCMEIKLNSNEINALLKEMDYNNDGNIDAKEFYKAFIISFTENKFSYLDE